VSSQSLWYRTKFIGPVYSRSTESKEQNPADEGKENRKRKQERKIGNGRNLQAFPFLQQCPPTHHSFWLVTTFGWDGRKELTLEGYHMHISH